MSDGWAHDFVAMIQGQAFEQIQDIELNLIGHVIEYDVTTNMCRVILPTRRAVDAGGNDQPMETGWCQVGSGQVGNGHGDQYALKGGATAANPELGEQVQVSIQHRASGLCAVANLTYNDTMKPPGIGTGSTGPMTALVDITGTAQLQPGERIIKHESGSFIKFYSNGDIGLHTARNLVLNSHTDCDITVAQGNLNATVTTGQANITAGTVNIIAGVIKAGTGVMQQLANAYHALTTFNSHTHASFGAPPVPQAVIAVDTTSNLEAS